MIPIIILMIEDDSDREFMERFYLEYNKLMRVTASKYIFSSHIADEIVHDTIVHFIENIQKLRSLEHCVLPGYIVISIRRRCYNYLKHRKIEQKYNTKFNDDLLGSAEHENYDSIEGELLKKYDIGKMVQCLRLLPERMQELLEFKYFLDMPDYEIADLMGIKKNSVRQALTRARRALYSKMKEHGYE